MRVGTDGDGHPRIIRLVLAKTAERAVDGDERVAVLGLGGEDAVQGAIEDGLRHCVQGDLGLCHVEIGAFAGLGAPAQPGEHQGHADHGGDVVGVDESRVGGRTALVAAESGHPGDRFKQRAVGDEVLWRGRCRRNR